MQDPSIFADNGNAGWKHCKEYLSERVSIGKRLTMNVLPGRCNSIIGLAFDADGLPMVYIFKNCKDFLSRTFRTCIYDLYDVEDVGH